jgi:hypothetical protein
MGEPLERNVNEWMTRGQALEAQAVKAYCFERDCELQQVGFITTDDGLIGCSPDRLVIGQNGGVEIKCPMPASHVGHMCRRELDEQYRPQIMGQMLIAELDWVDWTSYCPGLPAIIVRVYRDEEFISKLREALSGFVETMLRTRERLEKE